VIVKEVKLTFTLEWLEAKSPCCIKWGSCEI